VPSIRAIVVGVTLAATLVVVAAPAAAATRVTVTPTSGTAGDRVVIRGSGFGTTEFCRPRATLRVLGVVIARAVVDDHGTFRVRWVIPEAVGTGDRPMHRFRALTLAPIDRRLVDKSLLSPEEIAQFDAYHVRVVAEIGPRVEPEIRAWLAEAYEVGMQRHL